MAHIDGRGSGYGGMMHGIGWVCNMYLRNLQASRNLQTRLQTESSLIDTTEISYVSFWLD